MFTSQKDNAEIEKSEGDMLSTSCSESPREEEAKVDEEEMKGETNLQDFRRTRLDETPQNRQKKRGKCSRPCSRHCKPSHLRKKNTDKNRERQTQKHKKVISRSSKRIFSPPPSQSSTSTTSIVSGCCGISVQQCTQLAADWLTRAVQAMFLQHQHSSTSFYASNSADATEEINNVNHVAEYDLCIP